MDSNSSSNDTPDAQSSAISNSNRRRTALHNASSRHEDDVIELVELPKNGSSTSAERDGLLVLGSSGDVVISSSFSKNASDHNASDHHGVAAPGTASNGQVAMNIIISFVGAGMLGIPDAFRQSGWCLGAAVLLSVSCLNVYAMLLLPQTKRHIAATTGVTIATYGDLGGAILGPHGATLVNICLGISQAGFATAYLIFIASNLMSIVAIPRVLTCLLCIPGLSALAQFQDMKHLAPFSLLANAANFCALTAVLLQDYESYQHRHLNMDYGVVEAVKWEGLLYVVAVTIYSMEGIGLILSLEESCRTPSQFPWLLRCMLAGISLFMAFFGTAGYWAFGDATEAPITLNLGADHVWAATFVKCSLCLGLYLTHPIMMFPIWSISQTMYPILQEHTGFRVAFRTGVVVLSTLVAYAIPDFGKFLSLVGSSICTLLAFVLPGYFHLRTFAHTTNVVPKWTLVLDVFFIVGGGCFGLVGTYQSVSAMLNGTLEAE